jgi:dipeptide transport system permease protein
MLTFIARRLVMLPVVLFAISIVIVGMLQFIPPERRAANFIRSQRDLQNLDRLIEDFGFDKPFYVQYWTWLREVLQGNLGYSRGAGEPVAVSLQKRLPVSAELALFSFVPILILGIWLGIVAALHRGGFWDNLISNLSIISWSLPQFVFGIFLLVMLYGLAGLFGIGRISSSYAEEIARGTITTPTGFMTVDALLNGRPDMLLNALNHLALPVLTIVMTSFGQIVQVMRDSVLEVMPKDYVRTAKAKGLAPNKIAYKHVLKNAMIPVITVSGLLFSFIITGVTIVETIFGFNGLGAFFTSAAATFDTPVVLGFSLLLALIVLVSNLITDLLYGLFDPRIRYD